MVVDDRFECVIKGLCFGRWVLVVFRVAREVIGVFLLLYVLNAAIPSIVYTCGFQCLLLDFKRGHEGK